VSGVDAGDAISLDVIGAPVDVIARLCPLAVLTAAFAHNLHYSWLKWGDLVADCGNELEVPRQLVAGHVLYRDVRYFYGPLAPYLNALLFRVFGVHAGVLMAAGAVSAALMCALLYALTRQFTGRLPATLAAGAFLYLCAFGHLYWNGSFNWVLPYSYAATYGMVAGTASLLFLIAHATSGTRQFHVLAVSALGLSALTKLEPLVAAAAAHVVFVIGAWPLGRRRIETYAAGTAVVVAVYAAFRALAGGALWTYNLAILANPRMVPMFRLHAGLADWRTSVTVMAVAESTLALGLVATVAGVASLIAARLPLMRWSRLMPRLLTAATAAIVYAGLPLLATFRVLPVLAASVLPGLLRRCRGDPLPRALLWGFALACLARTPLAAGAFHYGFYLLPVPLAALVVFWFEDLGRLLPPSPARAAIIACGGAALITTVTYRHYARSRPVYDHTTVLVRAPRGTMYVLDRVAGFPTGDAHAETVRRLAELPAGTRVIAGPTGVGLSFVSGSESSCGWYGFFPNEVPTDGADERLLDCLRRDPPDVVVWLAMDLFEEWGSRGFGVDYARRSAAWLQANYAVDARIGPAGYVTILKPAR